MYDKEIARLEQEVEGSDLLLRFFKAYLYMQPGNEIKISDAAVQIVTGEEKLEVTRVDSRTVIKLSSQVKQ